MSTDQPGPSRFKDIKARFESANPASNNNHSESSTSSVAQTKRLFEKTKNPINASNRFKPALKPKPKYLSQQKIDPQPPPVPKHASFNRSIVSPVFKNKFTFSESNNKTTSNESSLFSSMSSTLSSTDNFRDSHMSDDVLPSTPTATDTPADSSSSEDSSPEFDEDDFYDRGRTERVNEESSKVETLHTAIINQMKKDGLFKQLETIKANQNRNDMSETENGVNNGNYNEEENGVVMREAPDVPLQGVVDKYFDAEGPEKERLIMMERLAAEIGMKEEHFVRIMALMIRSYPEYLGTCKLKGGKYGKYRKTVSSIVYELEPVLKIHENLLNEFVHLCLTWDSRTPNLANVLLKNVDFLQICVSFLTKKRQLCQDFKLTSDANAQFAHATHQFEVQAMNHPDVYANSAFEHMAYKPIDSKLRNSGVCFYQQLDMVHQNVVRYKLFMERYAKLLDPSSVAEIALTQQVLDKLDRILRSIDTKLDEPQAVAFLLKVFEKFQSRNFNVLMPGRQFIKEGLILKQAKKKLLERRLILFSDTLLICHLDYNQFWKIDLGTMNIKVEDGVERESWFILYSRIKSTAFLCSTKNERDTWVQKILSAQNELRAIRRRNEPREERTSTYSALWVPDDETTMCMMADCGRRFNFVQRRHHCRKCGFVICTHCSGYALLENDIDSSSRVCPRCYYEIIETLHNGTIKWSSSVADVNDKRIRFENGKEKLIKELFVPPRAGKKIPGDDYSDSSKYLTDGTVYTKNGPKYARLTTDFNLYLYAARYDPQPAEHYYVQGYSFTATENTKDDRVHFKLSQQTGPKNSVLEFDVPEKVYPLWEDALNQLK